MRAIYLLFFLQFIEINFKSIQFLGPEFPVLFYPTRYFIQLIKFRLTITVPSLLFDGDEPALGKNLYVLRNSGSAYIKFFRNRIQMQ